MERRRRQFDHVTTGHQGFTLTEILITLVIVGILASLGAPAFNDLIKSQKIKSMATDINASLALARSEAVKRNRNVTLAPTVASDPWQNGWRVTDPDADPDTPGNQPEVIEAHDAFEGLTATGPDDVTYRSSGRIHGNVAPEFDITAAGTNAHRCVSVDLSGRPYVKDAAC